MVLKVGIAGFGVVGRRRLACFEKNPQTKVTAVAERRFLEETPDLGIQTFSDYRDMIEQADIDILVVCLTNDVAPDATVRGLRRGRHVFCEKPPGRTVQDIQDVCAVEAEVSGPKLKYGFNHRYHESVVEAKRIIDSGQLGPLINMKGVYGKSQLVTFGQSDWRVRREMSGGGVLLDQGIHMVDLMRFFGGEFSEVHSFISNAFWGYDVEDNAYALMRSKTGVVAMLNSTATSWRHRFNLDITLERGALVLGGILSGSKSYGAETLTIVEASLEKDNGDPKETTIRFNQDPSWQVEVDDFVNHIIHDTPVESGSSLDALRTMEQVYRIYAADQDWKDQHKIVSPDIERNPNE